MEILLSKIIPVPIPGKDVIQSEIWGRDIKINTGDKILVYAGSGKGKTTFINILTGSRKDYTGDLYLNGKNIRNFSLTEIAGLRKNKFSIVPQGLLLFPELNVMENIQLKNKIQNYSSTEKIIRLLAILGLEGFESYKAGKLSYGQQQRVAIARALSQNFDFILLDEAFSHLDENNTKIAWDLILEEAEERKAGIIITSLQDFEAVDFIKLRI